MRDSLQFRSRNQVLTTTSNVQLKRLNHRLLSRNYQLATATEQGLGSYLPSPTLLTPVSLRHRVPLVGLKLTLVGSLLIALLLLRNPFRQDHRRRLRDDCRVTWNDHGHLCSPLVRSSLRRWSHRRSARRCLLLTDLEIRRRDHENCTTVLDRHTYRYEKKDGAQLLQHRHRYEKVSTVTVKTLLLTKIKRTVKLLFHMGIRTKVRRQRLKKGQMTMMDARDLHDRLSTSICRQKTMDYFTAPP